MVERTNLEIILGYTNIIKKVYKFL